MAKKAMKSSKSNLTKMDRLFIGTFFALAYFLVLILFLLFIIVLFGRSRGVFMGSFSVSRNLTRPVEPLPKFQSCDALYDQLKSQTTSGYGMMRESMGIGIAPPMALQKNMAIDPSSASPDYSRTNIQVAGVDEADIVKTDGKYLYTLTQGKLMIARAYPPRDAELLSKTTIQGSPTEIFIDKNYILVFGSRSYNQTVPLPYDDYSGGMMKRTSEMYPYPYYRNLTFADLYDIQDREDPQLVRSLEFEGNYISSRKIGKYVYFYRFLGAKKSCNSFIV